MQIILGALADDLSVQFEKAQVEYIGKTPLDIIQRSADAISLLSIRGYLSEAEARKARQRLVNNPALKDGALF